MNRNHFSHFSLFSLGHDEECNCDHQDDDDDDDDGDYDFMILKECKTTKSSKRAGRARPGKVTRVGSGVIYLPDRQMPFLTFQW